MRKSLVFLSICVFLVSCEENKVLITENTGMPLLSKILIGDKVYMEYVYNEANLITEEKSRFHYTKHIYNDDNFDPGPGIGQIQVTTWSYDYNNYAYPVRVNNDTQYVYE